MTHFDDTIADFKLVADAVRRGIYKPPRLPERDELAPADPEKFAAAVIRAGMKRRNELKEPLEFSNDKAGQMARRIVNSARKRDGLEPI